MKSKVVIMYKSGQSVVAEYTKMDATWDSEGNIVKLEWDELNPAAIFMGINNVESIWMVPE